MIELRTIVCYIDFCALSSDVLDGAVQLARLTGAQVIAAVVVPLPGARGDACTLPDTERQYDVDYAQAAQDLDELVKSSLHAGVSVEPRVVTGDAPSALLSVATQAHADVVVLGATPARPKVTRMNRVQERLFRHCPCPVLVLNAAWVSARFRFPDTLSRPPRILVATALQPPSEHAVLAAIFIARRVNAELTLLHVEDRSEEKRHPAFGFWDFLAGFSSESQALLSSVVSPEWLSPPPRTILRAGHPDEAILDTAAHMGADLLVLGARQPPLAVPLWPSLDSRLASVAPCPVLAIGPAALTHFEASVMVEHRVRVGR